ncbi:MAG: hypothetical protein HYV07_24025 [Deltaproteobacteria bacterium]|nr:hypothetical protein [Deltaproteobacteria bacterium]
MSPIGLLLDNRTSNHTEEVKAAIGETLLMRSRLFRAENKAHVESAFGLLKQVAPPLEIEGASEQELAREFLRLMVEI